MWGSVRAGVPQGSILGPTLHLMYVMDIPDPPGALISIFADDTSLITHDAEYSNAVTRLQTAVNDIATWAQDWNINE